MFIIRVLTSEIQINLGIESSSSSNDLIAFVIFVIHKLIFHDKPRAALGVLVDLGDILWES